MGESVQLTTWFLPTTSLTALIEAGENNGRYFLTNAVNISGSTAKTIRKQKSIPIKHGVEIIHYENKKVALKIKDALFSNGLIELYQLLLDNDFTDLIIDSFTTICNDTKVRFLLNTLKNRGKEDSTIKFIKEWSFNKEAFKRGMKASCLDCDPISQDKDCFVHSDWKRMKNKYGGNIRLEIFKDKRIRSTLSIE